jgi:hypothetical protein
VSFSSDPGSFEPAQVTLNDQGAAVVTLRSVSVGTATLRATSPPLGAASATVRFVWPIATLVASVLGGLAGAMLKRLQRGPIRSRRALVPVLAAGLLSGIVVIALYAVGVNVLPIQPAAAAGEVLIFAVAAVGGFLGLQIKPDAVRR